jgi:RNA polymerase sigma-70 factor (ECF subfamily)
MSTPAAEAEAAARTSYGRLIAILSARSGDIAAAEDALADAFAAALETWPERGVPDRPEAWLITAARRTLANRHRHHRVEEASIGELLVRADERDGVSDPALLDRRLELLFVCAHPAIDAGVRTPLMLQTVLGLDAQRIGSAFLVSPSSMGQRLVRAKTKIKATAIRFEVPSPDELTGRLDDVLDAVYAAYGTGWDDLDGAGTRGLTEEALFLGRLMVTLLPDAPEPRGLLSLMLFCESRRDARRDRDGRFVPLAAQDTTGWTAAMIVEADQLLTTAARAGQFGRYQCLAAIQSVHAQRAVTGTTNLAALRTLYDLLQARAPSIGVAVARAAVLIDAGDLPAAARALDAIDRDVVATYQPYWDTRARLAEASGDRRSARQHVERALGLTSDPAVRAFLAARLADLG